VAPTRGEKPALFRHCEGFVLRTPLLPVAASVAWSSGLLAPETGDGATTEELAAALRADRETLAARLRVLFSQPMIREAIYLSSPGLSRALDRLGDAAVPPARLLRSMVRFFARMTARTELFGLFAGWSTGTIGASSRMRLEPAGDTRRCRLSMEYVQLLAQEARQASGRGQREPLFPAASVYRLRGRLCYAGKAGLVGVEPNECLDVVLAAAEGGGTAAQLTEALTRRFDDVSTADAASFVAGLVDDGILAPKTQLSPMDPDPADGLMAVLDTSAPSLAARARTALCDIRALERLPLGVAPELYEQVRGRLPKSESAPAGVFRVELIRPQADLRLADDVVTEIRVAAEILWRLRHRRRTTLDRFRDEFVERYGDREVPLTVALDPDAGIGFGGSRWRRLEVSPFESSPPRAVAPPRVDILASLLRQRPRGIEEVWVDVASVRRGAPASILPGHSFVAQAVVIASSAAAIDSGQFLVWLKSVSASPASRMLGRMAAVDPNVRALCERAVARETAADPDCAFAEISYIPTGKAANVVGRPHLYEYRLIFSGEPQTGDPADIPVADLRVSVRGPTIRLRSARLNRWIVPRLSSAHVPGPSHPTVYRFLVALQFQNGLRGASWSWRAWGAVPSLPRVRVGRAILARAEWSVGPPWLSRIGGARSDVELLRVVRAWRDSLKIPRWISVQDRAATEILVDLENVACLSSFRGLIRENPDSRVFERLPSPEDCCVESPDGHFVHDLLIPFVGQQAPSAKPDRLPAGKRAPSRQGTWKRQVPGSRWVDARLFGGPDAVDEALRGPVKEILGDLERTGLVRNWFFVRYGKPAWHLRIRVEGRNRDAAEQIALRLARSLASIVAEDGLWRLRFDTYDPETARYGGPRALCFAASIFGADSAAVLELLQQPSMRDARTRWEAAVVGLHLLCSSFEPDAEKRIRFLGAQLGPFQHRMATQAAFADWVQVNCRRELPRLRSLLRRPPRSEDEVVWRILEHRGERIARAVQGLRRLSDRGALWSSLRSIWASLTHMHLNRMFRAVVGADEDILLDLLRQHYRGELARAGASKGSAVDPGSNLVE